MVSSNDTASDGMSLSATLLGMEAELIAVACGDGPELPQEFVVRRMVDELTRRDAAGDVAAKALIRAWLWSEAERTLLASDVETYRPAWYPNDRDGFWKWVCRDDFAHQPECGSPRTDPEADIDTYY